MRISASSRSVRSLTYQRRYTTLVLLLTLPLVILSNPMLHSNESITAAARAPRIEPSAHGQNKQAPVAEEAAHPLVEPWCSAPRQTWLAVGPTGDGEYRPGTTVCD